MVTVQHRPHGSSLRRRVGAGLVCGLITAAALGGVTARAGGGSPTVTAVAPTAGQVSGGDTVVITGTNFVSGATVAFGNADATGVDWVDSTRMTAVTPPGSGTVNVTVTNPGDSTGVLASAYTYYPFAPEGVGQPVALLTPGGGQELVFWQGPLGEDHLHEAWYTFAPTLYSGYDTQWAGPQDLTTMLGIGSSGYLASAPTVTFTPDGGQQLAFWQGINGDLWEAWYTLATHTWNAQDLSAVRSLQGAGAVASTPTITFTPGGGQQLVFWRGSNDDIWEAWYTVATNTWSSADLNATWLGGTGAGTVASQLTVLLTPGGGQQLAFWKGTNGHVWEAWYTVATATWNVQDLTAARFPTATNTEFQPDVLLTAGAGQQLIFYAGASTGDLWEAWYTVATNTWNAQDLSTTRLGGFGAVGSIPVVAFTPDGNQVVYWQGLSNQHLDEAWFSLSSSTWTGEDLTVSDSLPAGALLGGPPSLVVRANGEQDIFWEGQLAALPPEADLWELAVVDEQPYVYDWSTGGG